MGIGKRALSRASSLAGVAAFGFAGLAGISPLAAQSPDQAVLSQAFVQKIKNEIITSEISIAPSALVEPGLGALLVDGAVATARKLAQTAQDEAETEPDYFRPYSIVQSWEMRHQTPEYLSLLGSQWLYTGGAHGNIEFAGLLWRRGHDDAEGEDLPVASLFEGGGAADAPVWDALGAYLLDKWEAEWVVRRGEPFGPDDVVWREDAERTLDLKPDGYMVVTLLPSTQNDVAAGLSFHYAPYALGPYAMGTFVFDVPHGVFDEYLTPGARALFGGDVVAVAADE